MLLGDLFDLSLRGRADTAGLICEVAGRLRELTFGEIAGRAARIAAVLRGRGLEPGDRLAVQLPNRLEFIELFLACIQSGIVLVPINVLYREREIAHIVADAQPKLIVATEAQRGQFPTGSAARRHRGADPRSAGPSAGRQPRRAASGHRRRRAGGHRLHLGHHRPLQGRGADPQQLRRQRRRPRHLLAHHQRRPLPGGAAALPRPRPGQRRLRVARLRLPDAPHRAVRGGQGARLVPRLQADAVLRRADRLRPPAGAAGRRGARDRGADAAVRVGLGAAAAGGARAVPRALRPHDPRALRHERDAHARLQPARGRAPRRHRRLPAAGRLAVGARPSGRRRWRPATSARCG